MEKETITLSEYIAMTAEDQASAVNDIISSKEGMQPVRTETDELTNSLHFYFE